MGCFELRCDSLRSIQSVSIMVMRISTLSLNLCVRIGRILNRFAKDIGIVDETLPSTLFDTMDVRLYLISVIFVRSFHDHASPHCHVTDISPIYRCHCNCLHCKPISPNSVGNIGHFILFREKVLSRDGEKCKTSRGDC